MPPSLELELKFQEALRSLLDAHDVRPETIDDCQSILKKWVESRSEQLAVDATDVAGFLRNRRNGAISPELEKRIRAWFAGHELTPTKLLDRRPEQLWNEAFSADERTGINDWLRQKKAALKAALNTLPRCAVIESENIPPEIKTRVAKGATGVLQDLLWFRSGQFDNLWLARVYGKGLSDDRYKKFRGFVVMSLWIPFEQADDFIQSLYTRLHPRGGGRWTKFQPHRASFLAFAKWEARGLANLAEWANVRLGAAGGEIGEQGVPAGPAVRPDAPLIGDEEAQRHAARLRETLQELFTLDSAPHQIITFAFHRLFDLSDSEVADSVWYGRIKALLKLLCGAAVEISASAVELAVFLDSSDRANLASRIQQPVRRILSRRQRLRYAEYFGAAVRADSAGKGRAFQRGSPENRARFARFLRTEAGELRLCDFQLAGNPTSNVRKFCSAVLKRMKNRRAEIYGIADATTNFRGAEEDDDN